MTNLDEIESWLHQELPALAARHRLPGLSVAIAAGDRTIDYSAGLLSLATGVQVTPDSVFQIGSITKVWTATLVMQLVDDGLLDLDAPLTTYLPDFRLADQAAASAITTRHLLSHTGGFEGEVFLDTGVGDDCVEKYVAALADVPQTFPPGAMFSYNNAAFSVLGRLVEVLRGAPYDDCLRQHLIAPLGLTDTAAGVYDAILHRAAVGHLEPAPGADLVPAPLWSLPRSLIPSGATLAMSARDLVSFARMHVGGGSLGGTAVLSAASVRAMQEWQIDVPYLGDPSMFWGLGWQQWRWSDQPVFGHNGGTIGQRSFLLVAPERQVVLVLLANGGDVAAVYDTLASHVFEQLAGISVPPVPVPPAQPSAFDASRYLGTYTSSLAERTVSQDEHGRLWVDVEPSPVAVALGDAPQRYELVHLSEHTFLTAQTIEGRHAPHTFVGADAEGRSEYLHWSRADRRRPS